LMGSTNADATFTQAAGSPLPTASSPAGIVIANFTGGNVPSLAVTNKGVNTLGIYIGLGQGTFSNRLEIATPTSPSAIISAVLTSSGLPDVALTALGDTASQGVVTIIQDSSSFAKKVATFHWRGELETKSSRQLFLCTPSLHEARYRTSSSNVASSRRRARIALNRHSRSRKRRAG